MYPSNWQRLTYVAALACLVGCSGGGASLDTVPVSGTVTLDGQPVDGATVTFSPAEGAGRAAVGITDAAGKFQLTTVATGDGAIPGSYKVAVAKAVAAAAAQSGPASDPRSSGALSPEEQAAALEAMKKSAAPSKPQLSVPEKYASPDTSGFIFAVADDGNNDFTIAMTR